MGISLAPTPDTTTDLPDDPLKKTLPAVPRPAGVGLAPLPSLSGAAVAPAAAPMASAAIPPSAYGATVPAPTVAAPSAPVDRVKLATDTFNTVAAGTQGAYDAASRDNIHNSAALGQIASGGLRTREGNLQLARARDLDTMRKDLVNKATEGSIADASTAYQQQLASSQQGLAEKIGLAGIDTQKGSLDLAKKANEQQFGLEGEKLGLAREQTAAQSDQAKAALALQEKLGLGGLSVEQQRVAIAQKQQDIEAAFQAKQIGLAERNAALSELTQAQNNTLSQGKLALDTQSLAQTGQQEAARLQLAKDTLTQTGQQEAARLQLAKDTLTQTGQQFGLSLAQSKDLATLADKTQNRQLDISSAQGKTSLMLELARIMGAKDPGAIDPGFIAAIARALGLSAAPPDTPPVVVKKPPTDTGGRDPRDTLGLDDPTGKGGDGKGSGDTGRVDADGQREFNPDGTLNPKYRPPTEKKVGPEDINPDTGLPYETLNAI